MYWIGATAPRLIHQQFTVFGIFASIAEFEEIWFLRDHIIPLMSLGY